MNSLFPDKMPAWIKPTIVLLFVISWIPLAMVAQRRATPTPQPRMSLIPDMDKQEKYTAQSSNPLFKDGRAMRPLVAGTVAYGQAHDDTWLYRGIRGGQWATDFPIKPTESMMLRGQRQFNIYCSPCHGLGGFGNGMVAVHADALMEGTWTPPANLHDKLVMGRPVGHIFNTITNGIRNMPPYGPQISVEDRWAIVLYVRALQRSQAGSINDVNDPSEKGRLQAERMSQVKTQPPAGTATGQAEGGVSNSGQPSPSTTEGAQPTSPQASNVHKGSGLASTRASLAKAEKLHLEMARKIAELRQSRIELCKMIEDSTARIEAKRSELWNLKLALRSNPGDKQLQAKRSEIAKELDALVKEKESKLAKINSDLDASEKADSTFLKQTEHSKEIADSNGGRR